MLGKYVRVRVTNPIRSVNRQFGFVYQLNFGAIEGKKRYDSISHGAYIMGINHPVRTFDGRVIAAIKRSDGSPTVYIVAPKSMRFISYQIEDAIEFAEKGREYKLECLYERSCGAVVYRRINGELRYLLIKNRRSNHWGFPKGHMEKGETREETAMREVLEETGIHINIVEGFCKDSQYKIGSRIEKRVEVFLGSTEDTQTIIQKEEIEDYRWLRYPEALDTLKFENDKEILMSVKEFMTEHAL